MERRNKRQDWTDVLRERLQDAQLPLEDGWGASAAASGRARRAWWPVALAGAAAAILAAVLLLRPQPKPEPTRLVQANPPVAVDTASTTTLLDSTPVISNSETSSARQTQPSFAGLTGESQTRPDTDRLPQDSTDVQNTTPTTPDSISVTPGSNRGLLTENEIPDQVGEDKSGAVKPLSEIALADLEDIPGQGRDDVKKSRGRRIALRVQAGFAGTSLSNGIGSINTLKAVTIPGEWIPASDYKMYTHSSAHTVYGDDVINSGSGNWHEEVQWYYRPEQDVMTPMTVAVRKAPVFPISFGVSAALPLSRSWVLTAGLDYMQRDGYRVYDYNPQSLTLHYLGIPVDIHYYFNPESRWRFYLGAGVHAGKCIAATGGEPLQDPVLFSGNVMVGTDIRLFPGIRLYLAPALSGFFNQSAYLNTWDSKAYFQLRAGLSFDLK